MTVLNKKSSTTVNTGDIIFLEDNQIDITNSTTSISGGTSAGSVTISLPNTFFGVSSDFPILKLTATVEVINAKPRLKTSYKNKRILIISPGDRIIPLRGIDVDSNSDEIISYSDVVKILYVYEGSSQTPLLFHQQEI